MQKPSLYLRFRLTNIAIIFTIGLNVHGRRRYLKSGQTRYLFLSQIFWAILPTSRIRSKNFKAGSKLETDLIREVGKMAQKIYDRNNLFQIRYGLFNLAFILTKVLIILCPWFTYFDYIELMAGLRPNSEIIGNFGILKIFLKVFFWKWSLHKNFEVRKRDWRRDFC